MARIRDFYSCGFFTLLLFTASKQAVAGMQVLLY